jgi:glycerol-1-phosphate dehydrogenase [NAD(P)+]
MAEHQISHFIDMFAGADHPGSSHGEQVGVGTITMSALQNQILQSDTPPLVVPTEIPAEQLQKQFGIETAKNMIAETKRKALDAKAAEALNHKLQEDWPAIAEKLNAVMIPFDQLQQSMRNAGCALTATDLGLNTDFYRDAVTYARFIRDRFSMLDLVDDSTGLESFVSQMQV